MQSIAYAHEITLDEYEFLYLCCSILFIVGSDDAVSSRLSIIIVDVLRTNLRPCRRPPHRPRSNITD